MTATIAGTGTDEAQWRPWLEALAPPPLDMSELRGRRVVVLAAHPDDEVLGVGGLLAGLAAAGSEIVAMWATDGEASHPRSATLSPERLKELRPAESQRALDALGASPALSIVLGLPDGAVADHAVALRTVLGNLLRDDDVVLAPWRNDGHPDHDAVGSVAAEIAATLLEYPVWMWHWASPGDVRVPWSRLRTVAVTDRTTKAKAVDCFDTQVRPLGPAPEDAAIIPPAIRARFQRPFEVVLA